MIRKFHEAKESGKDEVVLWGDGSPYREFLYSEDLADAVVFLMENRNASDLGEFINIGTGVDLPIKELANIVKTVVYQDSPSIDCKIVWDNTKPNGTPQKLLDVSKLNALGFKAKTDFKTGIELSYKDFCLNKDK